MPPLIEASRHRIGMSRLTLTSTRSEDAGNVYNSVPLPPGSNHSIRVLDLKAGKKNDKLQARLYVMTLSNSATRLFPSLFGYEALSYTWGSCDSGRHISVNEHSMMITDNLFDALRRLRRSWRSRTLWIDAICINQNDEREKAQQVAMMGHIYRNAVAVNIWLGEIGPLKIAERSYEHDSKYRWQDRAWIIQEFVLARKIYFCVGQRRAYAEQITHRYCHELFRRRLYCPQETAMSLSLKIVELGSVRRFQTASGQQEQRGKSSDELSQEHPGSSITACFNLLRGTAASDPRDMIYCLLALMEARPRDRIRIDYSRSVEDVYALATYELLVDKSIDARLKGGGVLRYVSPLSQDRENLPSWAIDFRTLPFQEGSELFTSMHPYLHDEFTPSLITKTGHLELLGALAGAIKSLAVLPEEGKDIRIMLYRLAKDRDIAVTPSFQNFNTERKLLSNAQILELGIILDQLIAYDARVFLDWLNDVISEQNVYPIYFNYITPLAADVYLFVTESGWGGLIPGTAQPGDILYQTEIGRRGEYSLTSCIYFVLRPEGDHFSFRGLALGFAHPMVHGPRLPVRRFVVH